MNYNDLKSMMEGLDISTSPASNAGAPGITSNSSGDNTEIATIAGMDYQNDLIEMTQEQENLLLSQLNEYSSESVELYDFTTLIKNIIK